jgi:ergothioneine biosynthesis protein EgtB
MLSVRNSSIHNPSIGERARRLNRAELALALRAARADTLSLFAAFRSHLNDLMVPRHPNLNPPLWELGHVGWFQEYWTVRNPQLALGLAADPACFRTPGVRANADTLYSSTEVVHERRWGLALPGIDATLGDLDTQLARSLETLEEAQDSDTGLYFHRLALLHEDMHHEAGLYMAQALGIPVQDPRWQCPRLPDPPLPLQIETCSWFLGSVPEQGFAFDNELPGSEVPLKAFEIDAQVVRWREYLPFVAQDGYRQTAFWTPAGRQWLTQTGLTGPTRVRPGPSAGGWQLWRHGQWSALSEDEPAVHLSLHEAQAWCAWAGRRLPLEAEWEASACLEPQRFRWGEVWEWTASPHTPFAGFAAHPYRDYAAPFFDGRPILRGASYMTQPRMRHARYRNFFRADRNDIAAGFRSCAI